jgi:hypothetical protein
MPDFERIATRTGGQVNTNSLHHLGVMYEQLSGITVASRLSGHGLTLNSTADGRRVLEAIYALCRAEQRMLALLEEVGGVRQQVQEIAAPTRRQEIAAPTQRQQIAAPAQPKPTGHLAGIKRLLPGRR